jgi:hypothetical protein
MAHCAVAVKVITVKAGYASGFLPAMLQCVKAKGNQSGRVFTIGDAKNAALLSQFVVVKRMCGQHCGDSLSRLHAL